MPFVDALKAIASQLIVLHHLSAYGPLSELMQDVVPALMGWLFEYGRIAVQAFLVVAGFLAVRGLAPRGEPLFDNPLPLIGKRYLRLVIPFMVALVIAIACSALARHWMDDESIPEPATWRQWLAHAALLHGVMGFDSLSAGVWYVAIDLQLFALLALTLWAGRVVAPYPPVARIVAPTLVIGLGILSLFWFNRSSDLDNWAIYFFGSYSLGAAAWWASQRGRLIAWLGVITTVVVAALVVDFRLRIAVALVVALALGFSRHTGWLERWPNLSVLAFLGKISYSVFLVHFPICLVVNAAFLQFDFESTRAAMVAMALAWSLSLVAGTLFHRYVEAAAPHWPLGRLAEQGLRRGLELALMVLEFPIKLLVLLASKAFGRS